jgi:predicted nucleic acid-binding protein
MSSLSGARYAPESTRSYTLFIPTLRVTDLTGKEVLSGAEPHELQVVREYMAQFTVYDLDDVIAEEAAGIRRAARTDGVKVLKSPDATLLATARYTGRKVTTRNTKDFSSVR